MFDQKVQEARKMPAVMNRSNAVTISDSRLKYVNFKLDPKNIEWPKNFKPITGDPLE